METKFDFSNDNNAYIHKIDQDIILHIKRINNSVANLYFTDEKLNKINIPDKIFVFTYNYENRHEKIPVQKINQGYILCWTDNYTVEFNKKVLINIKNQRQWNIYS
jgi:hypothetical protein